jgi:ribosomal protein S18 acetylase RimI-like enzyme
MTTQSLSMRAASQVDIEALVEGMNTAYEDYFVPMHMTVNSMQSLISRDSIDMDGSVVVVDRQKVVGTSLLGKRLPRGWVGGVGVIEAYRRQGIARWMMEILIENAQERGIKTLVLEVIKENIAAYQLYLDLGFRVVRHLSVLAREPGDATPITGYRVIHSAAKTALNYYEAFHETPNPWQRGLPSLRAMLPYLEGRLIAPENEPEHVLGYFVGAISSRRISMLDIAVQPGIDNRAQVGRALLSSIHHETPEAETMILNLPQNDLLYPVMQAMGYQENIEQYEMQFDL